MNIINQKKILKDWNEQFSLLSPYGSVSLMMKLDIFIVGVRIERSIWGGDSYIPRFTVLSLWSKNADNSLRLLVSQDLRNKKQVQYFFDSQHYQSSFMDAISCATEQFGFLFREKILLSDFFRYLSDYCNTYRQPSLMEMVCIHELKLALALYVEDGRLLEILKRHLEYDMKRWNQEQFEYIYHERINHWRDQLYALLEDRQIFMASIHENSTIPKISKLKEGHIVNDADTVLQLLKTKEKHINGFLSLFGK